jgi:hypothetical protein
MDDRKKQQQIPPLRCGMTNKKNNCNCNGNGNGKSKAVWFSLRWSFREGGPGLRRLGLRRVGI